MAERSLLKNAFFYVCVEFPCFFYASVEIFHASDPFQTLFSAHSMSTLLLKLTTRTSVDQKILERRNRKYKWKKKEIW